MTASFSISGEVIYVDLSGGFWGIQGDDGQQYLPTHDLPERLKEPGTRIRAQVRLNEGFSIYMWGQMVDVLQIDQLA